MRKWSVIALEAIEQDMALASMWAKEEGKSWLESAYDYEWFAERVNTRSLHGERFTGQCDGCPPGDSAVVTCVSDYADDMGAPSILAVNYLCNYHIRQN